MAEEKGADVGRSVSQLRNGRLLLAIMIGLSLIAGTGARQADAQSAPGVVADTLCASPWTSALYYLSTGCLSGYQTIDLAAGEVDVCSSPHTGQLFLPRTAGCSPPFLPLTIGGIEPVTLCVSGYTGALRYAPSGACVPSEARLATPLEKLLEDVTLAGVREHQAALQAIADANGGTRVSGTQGYNDSVAYAQQVFEAAGYDVTVQPFQFQNFISLSPSILEQIAPPPAGPVANTIMSYSGSGDNTAPVSTVALFGCNPTDYAGFPAGHIALISRGVCFFTDKATNAYNAGASGVIIYNDRPGILNGTLGSTFTLDISVTTVTQDVGQQLAATPGLIMRLKTDTFRGLATSYNVLAESTGGDPDNVVIVGAHLDSVDTGPGIQDNGSGVAAILEVAEEMAALNPRNKVRFALWGAEEAGLVGSTFYVNGLSPGELDDIALYLNFDMIGSPNYVFFIYDGDDSDGVGAGPVRRARLRSKPCSSHIISRKDCPSRALTSAAPRIMAPSLRRAYRPGGSSQGLVVSKHLRKPRSGAASPETRMIPAIILPATHMTISASSHSRSTRTLSPFLRCATR